MQNEPSFQATFAHRLRAIDRVYLSLAAGSVTGFAFYFFRLPLMMSILLGWLAFCFCYLSFCWYVIYTSPQQYILKRAAIEDGSRTFVFIYCAGLLCLPGHRSEHRDQCG